MQTLYFPGYGTAVIGNKEISSKKFFNVLEKNLSKKEYGVRYNEKDKTLQVKWQDQTYEVELWLYNSENADIKKLIMLSKIEPQIDFNTYEKNTSLAKLDTETKKYFLKMLKKGNVSVKKYFRNLGVDLSKSLGEFFEIIDFETSTSAIGVFGFFGFVIAAVICVCGGPAAWFWLAASGIPLVELVRIGAFLVSQIPARSERLVEYLGNKKIKKEKIKALKNELKHDYIEMKEEKVGNTVKYVPVIEKNDEYQIENQVPKMIDELVESLNDVDKVDVADIKEEIRDLVSDYREITLNNNMSDAQIFINHREIFDKISNLQLRVNKAKLTDGEIEVYNASRLKDTDYILDKLNSLDPKGKNDGKSKKLK